MTEEEKKNVAKKVVEEEMEKSSVDFNSLTLEQIEELRREMNKVYNKKKIEEEEKREAEKESVRKKMYDEVNALYQTYIKAKEEYIKARDEYVKEYGYIKLNSSSNNGSKSLFDIIWG